MDGRESAAQSHDAATRTMNPIPKNTVSMTEEYAAIIVKAMRMAGNSRLFAFESM